MLLRIHAARLDAKKKKAVDLSSHQWLNEIPERLSYPGLVHRGFYSEANKDLVGYCVYLPPGYDDPENSERRYPVVYMLHGGRPGSELKLVRMSKAIPSHINQTPSGDNFGFEAILVNGPDVLVIYEGNGKLPGKRKVLPRVERW